MPSIIASIADHHQPHLIFNYNHPNNSITDYLDANNIPFINPHYSHYSHYSNVYCITHSGYRGSSNYLHCKHP